MSETDDQDLVRLAREGDEAAFAEIVARHGGRIHGIALGMLRNEQDARDVVQESFLNAHKNLESFRGDAPLGSWLSRIATNNALMKLRSRRRKPESPLEIKGVDSEGPIEREIRDLAPWADRVQEDKELGDRIWLAVDALPEKYRVVLILADLQQLSMGQIGELLDLSIPNVKTRLHRARLAVREQLATYLEGQD